MKQAYINFKSLQMVASQHLKKLLHKSSNWVEIKLHTENQLLGYPGSGLKISGGWVVSWAVTIFLT